MNRGVSRCLCSLSLLAFAGFLLNTGVSHSAVPKSEKDWKINGGGEVQPGTLYSLFNLTDKESVKYGSRTWGINLVWDKATNLKNIKFELKDKNTSITFNSVVAIHVKGGGYLRYENRTVGVNLGWSKTPVYEWVLGGGSSPGSRGIMTNAPVSVFNQKAKGYLVYSERRFGINLGWLDYRPQP